MVEDVAENVVDKKVSGVVDKVREPIAEAKEARGVKLAVNAVLAATAEMLAEVVALGEANGLERAALLEVLASSAAGSPFVGYKHQALLERRYAATFTTAMLLKDLRLVLDLAGDKGAPLPVTALVADVGVEAVDARGGRRERAHRAAEGVGPLRVGGRAEAGAGGG